MTWAVTTNLCDRCWVVIPFIPLRLEKTTSVGHLTKTNQEITWPFGNKVRAPGHELAALLREAGSMSSHDNQSKNRGAHSCEAPERPPGIAVPGAKLTGRRMAEADSGTERLRPSPRPHQPFLPPEGGLQMGTATAGCQLPRGPAPV